MALTVAISDVLSKRVQKYPEPEKGIFGRNTNINLFGTPGTPSAGDMPHATFLEFEPGRVSHSHFHGVDQFQVVVSGKGNMGRHELRQYGVHFSRAYTPYGPFKAHDETGMNCFNLHARAYPNPSSHHLPQKAQMLKEIPGREPWQITSHATFPVIDASAGSPDAALAPVLGIADENGLAAQAVTVKPNAKAQALDPSSGVGQFIAVVDGSLKHDGKEFKAPSLIFVYQDEPPFNIHAGADGVKVLVLNFPRTEAQPAKHADTAAANKAFTTRQCSLCSFVYDEAAGRPEEGIAPGTRWQDVPQDWTCPDCDASKDAFESDQ